GPGAVMDNAVGGRRQPPDHGMVYPALDVLDGLAGVPFVPLPIKALGHDAELDDQVARQVSRLDFAAFFLPEMQEGGLIMAHNYPGVGAPNKPTAAATRAMSASYLIGQHG